MRRKTRRHPRAHSHTHTTPQALSRLFFFSFCSCVFFSLSYSPLSTFCYTDGPYKGVHTPGGTLCCRAHGGRGGELVRGGVVGWRGREGGGGGAGGGRRRRRENGSVRFVCADDSASQEVFCTVSTGSSFETTHPSSYTLTFFFLFYFLFLPHNQPEVPRLSLPFSLPDSLFFCFFFFPTHTSYPHFSSHYPFPPIFFLCCFCFFSPFATLLLLFSSRDKSNVHGVRGLFLFFCFGAVLVFFVAILFYLSLCCFFFWQPSADGWGGEGGGGGRGGLGGVGGFLCVFLLYFFERRCCCKQSVSTPPRRPARSPSRGRPPPPPRRPQHPRPWCRRWPRRRPRR